MGPGHAGGNFVVSRVTAQLVPPATARPTGRFVRISLPGKDRILSLAEVQVFSGAENVALKGEAKQSSTDYDGPAKLAIDGNTERPASRTSRSRTPSTRPTRGGRSISRATRRSTASSCGTAPAASRTGSPATLELLEREARSRLEGRRQGGAEAVGDARPERGRGRSRSRPRSPIMNRPASRRRPSR